MALIFGNKFVKGITQFIPQDNFGETDFIDAHCLKLGISREQYIATYGVRESKELKNESTHKNILSMDQFLNESKSDFQVYHNQYSSAIDEVEKYANKMGYDLDKEEYGNAYIDAFFKPNDGQTKKDTLALYKNGKEQKKAIHVQIYGMGNKKYELNMYIN